MITITVQTEDFEGQIVKEECQFHLNKIELSELDMKYPGGLAAEMKRIEAEGDSEKMFQFIKEIMILGYGVKSANGKSFDKTPEITKEFRYGYVLPECLVEVLKDETGVGVFKFLRGMMPMSAQNSINEHAKSHPELAKFLAN